jgi:acetyl-CoA carboxylase carboxyltransferase component
VDTGGADVHAASSGSAQASAVDRKTARRLSRVIATLFPPVSAPCYI